VKAFHMVAPAVTFLGFLGACGDPAPNQQQAPSQTGKGPEQLIISLVEIAPGPAEPVHEKSEIGRAYTNDPEQIALGRQMYVAFNCVGCHFNGGGGMGPPLMDDQWIYGGSVENIAASIIQGRPNGMPSFRAIVIGDSVWPLAAYVHSLSAKTESKSQTAAPEIDEAPSKPD
jgi:cytochrome c oxidase cbb3-type subunit 3